MLSLKYHRQYLWVFFIMFMLLMCTALGMDCYYVATNGSGSGSSPAFQLRTPRFMNVVCVFVFATISAVLHNQLSKSVVKSDILMGNRKLWYMKSIKVKSRRRKVKKVARKTKHTAFTLVFTLCTITNLVPILVLYGLWVGKITSVTGEMSFTNWQNRTTLAPEFFIPALFIKYFSWYINGFLSGCRLFRKNPRRNILLASPLNI